MTFDEIDSIGQGRVWSGADAIGIGLVDYNGVVVDAIAHAAMLADIENTNPETVVYPRFTGFGTISFLPGLSVPGEVKEIAKHPFLNSERPLYLASCHNCEVRL